MSIPRHMIDTWTEIADDGNQHIYFGNRSDALVIITGLRLTSFRGVRSQCGISKRLNVRLMPGARRRVFVVRLVDGAPHTSFRFQYQYEAWR